MKTARYFQYGDASVLRIDDVDALGSLRRRVSGAVLTAADAEYDDARAGFQTARSHSPAVLVAAASVDDIRQAVEFAKEQGLPVGVQGTGVLRCDNPYGGQAECVDGTCDAHRDLAAVRDQDGIELKHATRPGPRSASRTSAARPPCPAGS